MAQAILICTILILVITGFKSRIHGLGIWLFVLITHGIFVHLFGDGLQHMPLFMGLAMIPVAIFSRDGFKVDILPISLLFLFFASISVSFLVNGGDASSVEKVIAYIKPMFVCFLVFGCIKNRETLSVIARYVIAAAIIGSLFNIYQQIFGVHLLLNPWDKSLSRAAGLRGDPNDTAMLLLLALPLIYYKLINSHKEFKKYIYLVSAFMVIVGVVLTGSRAGFAVMALFAGALVMHKAKESRPKIFNIPSLKNIFLVIIFSVVAVLAAPGYYWERMSTLISGEEIHQSQSLYGRKYLLVRGFEIWLENPIVGVGPGQFHDAIYGGNIIISKKESSKNAVAHNMYVEFLAEFGILGFGVFMSLCVLAIRNFLRIDYLLFKNNKDQYIGYGYALGLFSMLLMGFTLSQGYNSVLWFVLGIGLGAGRWLTIALKKQNAEE